MLTKNAVFDIFNGKDVKNAIVQIIGITTVANTNSNSTRVRFDSLSSPYCGVLLLFFFFQTCNFWWNLLL